MKQHSLFFALLAALGYLLLPMSARAQTQLSAERFNDIDRMGWFPPAFKAAIRDYVETKQGIVTAVQEQKVLALRLPALKTSADAAEAKVAILEKQLTEYNHTDETDFVELKKILADPNAKPEDQLVEVQAYLWGYPASPHLAEAQQDLQMVQKTLADLAQAAKDAEAARVAARAKLIARAQAKDLSLQEWKDFLRDMSQETLVKYLGRPRYQGDYWVYTGDWTIDPLTHQKVGLQVTFNGGHVLNVSPAPPPQ